MLSKQLKKYRAIQEISQAKLADALGVSQQTVAKWETGKSTPDPYMLGAISDFFHITIDTLMGREKANNLHIPVFRSLTAERPSNAIEYIRDKEDLSPDAVPMDKYVALKIPDSSMAPRICEGDIVIVKRQTDAESGDLVVVLIGNAGAVIRRIKKLPNGILLIAANVNAYEPQFYSNTEIHELPVRIVGKAIELRGKL